MSDADRAGLVGANAVALYGIEAMAAATPK
jgi:hypothetical protein